MQETTRTTNRVIRTREAAERLGVSTTTLWRLRRSGVMPAAVQTSRRAVGWREDELERYIESTRETSMGANA